MQTTRSTQGEFPCLVYTSDHFILPPFLLFKIIVFSPVVGHMSVASDMLSHHTQVLSFKRNWDVIAQSTVGRFSKGDPGGMR